MAITLSNNDKLGLISNLATMLSAGIPIVEALESLVNETHGNARKVLLSLKADLNQGRTVSSGLEKFPNVFNPVTTNLVKAAEEAGTLETTLKDLTVNIKKEIEFNEKVRAALIYPALVMIVFIGVLLVILTFVIPRVSIVFTRLRVDLPLPTKILIFSSNILINNTVALIVSLVLITIALIVAYRTKKKLLINAFFSLPLLSGLARQIDLARFTHNMAMMLQSGIVLSEALDLSQNVVNKQEILRAIIKAKKDVNDGKPLSVGFKQSRKVIPGVMILITEAGEKSGTLEKSMIELNEYFDAAVSSTLKTLTTLLEPVMLVVVGLMVGGIMVSIVAPIYSLIGKINGK